MTEIDMIDKPLNDGIQYLINKLNETEKEYREKLTEYEKLFQEKFPYLFLAILDVKQLADFASIKNISDLTETHVKKCRIYSSYNNALCDVYNNKNMKSESDISKAIFLIKNSNYESRKYMKHFFHYNIDIYHGSDDSKKKVEEIFKDKKYCGYFDIPEFTEKCIKLEELKKNYMTNIDLLDKLFLSVNPIVFSIYDTNESVERSLFTFHSIQGAERKMRELSKIDNFTDTFIIVVRHVSLLKTSLYLLNINNSSISNKNTTDANFLEFIKYVSYS